MSIPYHILDRASGLLAGICRSGGLLMGLWAQAASMPPSTASGNYQFDKTISREVLENFLARSISVEGVYNGRGNLEDNIRMLKSTGAKYAGRSLCLWGAERNFLADLERARQQVPKALAADPEIILEACVFETVSPRVEGIAVPGHVIEERVTELHAPHLRDLRLRGVGGIRIRGVRKSSGRLNLMPR